MLSGVSYLPGPWNRVYNDKNDDNKWTNSKNLLVQFLLESDASIFAKRASNIINDLTMFTNGDLESDMCPFTSYLLKKNKIIIKNIQIHGSLLYSIFSVFFFFC